MEPPLLLVSFSDTSETHICGRDTCQWPLITCTEVEKLQWKHVSNIHNTNGDTTRWVCGKCIDYYKSRPTTCRRGAKLHLLSIELLTDFFPFQMIRFPSTVRNYSISTRMWQRFRKEEV